MQPVENKFEMKRVESFYIKEDRPKEEPRHSDKAIQEAVTTAILLVSESGKEILIGLEN